jgi:excisionase family DNA binding protein
MHDPNRSPRPDVGPRGGADQTELRPLLGVQEVSDILGVPKATLYQWHSFATRGHSIGPKAFRVGRHLRYSMEDLNAYIKALRDNAS